MRSLAVIVLVVVAAAAPTPAAGRVYEHSQRGISVEVPDGWRVRTASAAFVDPSLCVELRSPGSRRGGPVGFLDSGTTADGAEVRVVQLLSGRGPANDRQPFRLRTMAPPGAVMWTRGGLYTFRERSRSIYVGVLVGAAASAARRRTVERIVNSIVIAPRPGRCPESPRS